MKKLLVVVALAGFAGSGCASAHAKGKSEERPALMVPPPPPRLIEPAEPLPAEPVADPPNPPSGTQPPRPGRPASRETQPKSSEVKPDPKAVEVPPLPPVAEAPPAVVPPAAQLRTPQTADASGTAKAVRTAIDTARGLLNGVDFGPLSNERKKAYNDAKLLIQQAEDGLKQGNLAFAQGVANKAVTLSKELAGR
jgi:hypothetical protein